MGEELDADKIYNDQVLCRVGREGQAWRHDSLGVVLENVEARSSSLSRLTEFRRGSLCIDEVAVAGHGSVALGVTNVLRLWSDRADCPNSDCVHSQPDSLQLTLSPRRLCP